MSEEQELHLKLTENIDDIRDIMETMTEKIERILEGNVPIKNVKDIIRFIETMIDLIRGVINTLLAGSQISTEFIRYIIDICQNLIDIILENKNMIEIIILILPSLPFIYLLSQIVGSI